MPARMTSFLKSPGAVLNLRSIRRASVPYFAGWVIIFTWLYCYFLPNGRLLFVNGAEGESYGRAATYIWLIVCPLITTLSKADRYVPKTIYSVILALLCFAGLLAFKTGAVALLLQIAMAACVGHIFASCGYGFFMILNNTEKFYSMVLGIGLPKVLLLLHPVIAQHLHGMAYADWVLLGCLAALLVCSAFFRKEKADIPVVGKAPFPKKAWSLMAMVFLVLAFNDVVAPLVLVALKEASGMPLELWYFGGIAAGLFLVVFLQKGFKLNIGLMLNISMALLAMGFVISIAIKEGEQALLLAAGCFGAAYSIGMVNIYYLSGFMAKKLRNLTFYRVGIILSAVYYFFGYGTVHMLGGALPIISIVSVCVVILFFVFSPLFLRSLYEGEWIDDSYRQDVTFESRLKTRLREAGLSPKESEVCELLLRGYTLRQTAAMLNIAYPTANTYCTALYRKLSINSRTELTILFKEFID
ncbi:MAG: helix-turn-helix transcriptional regulator [Eubacteriales bacterium]|nr:helix-turn-helix transcriptional regulator [Eubacteriales bacterium]